MQMATNGEAKGYSFHWKIENMSNLWWMKRGETVNSPTFTASELKDTNWSLTLYPMGIADESEVLLFLNREKDDSGPNAIEIYFHLAFLGKDGSILKEETVREQFRRGDYWGWDNCLRERVFVTERSAFLPEYTLTAQCTVWISDVKPVHFNRILVTTDIKLEQRSFLWRIDKNRILKSGMRNKFKDSLIGFDLTLYGFVGINVNMTSFHESIKYISYNTSIMDLEGNKEIYANRKYFIDELMEGALSSTLHFPKSLENQSKYFPNDTLSLGFEFVISTLEHFGYRKNSTVLENEVAEKEESLCTTVLSEDLKSLLNDGLLSDIVLRTPKQSFPAHQAILSTRSPVFRKMFSHDMMERNSGHVDIVDFEGDIVQKMLVYIYSGSLEDMQNDSLFKLYKIANKYEIMSLRNRCFSSLKEKLNPTNAFDVLLMSIELSDENLKISVEDYILRQPKIFFLSQEWKVFMVDHTALASDLMYRKITKN